MRLPIAILAALVMATMRNTATMNERVFLVKEGWAHREIECRPAHLHILQNAPLRYLAAPRNHHNDERGNTEEVLLKNRKASFFFSTGKRVLESEYFRDCARVDFCRLWRFGDFLDLLAKR